MRKFMLGLHGFNVNDNGLATIDKLRPFAEWAGYTWVDGDYGWKGLVGVNIANEPIAGIISQCCNHFLGPEDYVVLAGHSNGCAISALVDHTWTPNIKQLLLINPALDRDWVFSERLDGVHIFGTPGDVWTGLSRWLPGMEWGAMSNGYEGDQEFVLYHDMSKDKDHPINSHSAVFEDENDDYWLRKMINCVQACEGMNSGD